MLVVAYMVGAFIFGRVHGMRIYIWSRTWYAHFLYKKIFLPPLTKAEKYATIYTIKN